MTGKLFRIVIPLSAAALLQGCFFTGIESTPKITAKDLQRQNVTTTPEDIFAQTLAPEKLDMWEKGRKLLVTDEKLSMVLEREPKVNVGDTLSFAGYELGTSITGDTLTTLIFRNLNSQGSPMLRYPLQGSPQQITRQGYLNPPFTIDLDIVDNARNQLKGKTYYLLSPLRVNDESRPIANGRKFIKVTISDVYAANDLYPLRVDFIDEKGTKESVVMTIGNDRRATRNFNTVFSFTDPRLRYPLIANEIWNNIINGTVAEGMTPDECRLAIGIPDDVRKGHNGAYYFEQWRFDNGSYLIFEDGRLTNFRR